MGGEWLGYSAWASLGMKVRVTGHPKLRLRGESGMTSGFLCQASDEHADAAATPTGSCQVRIHTPRARLQEQPLGEEGVSSTVQGGSGGFTWGTQPLASPPPGRDEAGRLQPKGLMSVPTLCHASCHMHVCEQDHPGAGLPGKLSWTLGGLLRGPVAQAKCMGARDMPQPWPCLSPGCHPELQVPWRAPPSRTFGYSDTSRLHPDQH